MQPCKPSSMFSCCFTRKRVGHERPRQIIEQVNPAPEHEIVLHGMLALSHRGNMHPEATHKISPVKYPQLLGWNWTRSPPAQLWYSAVSLSTLVRLNASTTLTESSAREALYVYHCFNPLQRPPQDAYETLERTVEMNLYCHFARGLGESKYMPVESWSSLNKTLLEVLDSYNEVNATLNLVLFEDAMAHMWVSRTLQ